MAIDDMKCPGCGATMNHHADKLIYQSEFAETDAFFGVIEQFFQCPRCGAGASRPESP